MVSTWVYKKIPEDIRPRLQTGTEDMASGAGGGNIQIWGWAKFKLQLGPVELIREAVVAEIIDDVLLGDDILRRDHEGPMDILNSKKIILFRGQEIPLLQVGLPKRAFQISTIDDELIPGMTEKILNVFKNRPDEAYDTYIEDSMLVEANSDFVVTNRCLVTPVVVCATWRSTTKIRVFNPFVEPTLLRGDKALGELIPVDVERTLRDAEHPNEKKNHNCMRRIQVKRRSSKLIKRWIRQTCKEWRVRNPHGLEDSIPPHLEDLITLSSEGWDVQQQMAIRKLLLQYPNVFSKNDYDLGETHLVPLAFADEEKKQIGKMLEAGLVRPLRSPWASQVCLVRKPDGSARVCVDYRGLNAVTIPVQQPIPRTEDCINSLSGGRVYSIAAVTKGYCQVGMNKEDIQKTAFTSRYGLLEICACQWD